MKEHKISLVTAILMSMNIMVGSGILIGPGNMAKIAGNASFITWLIVAALFLPIVLSTVQMARLNPGAGGFYLYAKAGLGNLAGYWAAIFYIGGYTFAVAVEILALREVLFEALGDNWTWFTDNPPLFNLVIAVILIGLNLLGLKFFSRILSSFTIWKIIPVATLVLLLPFIFNPSFTITASEVSQLPRSLTMAIFGFLGFEYSTSISQHIEDSERNAPLAILLGFVITALLYTLFTFGVLNLMGPAELAEQGASMFADYLTLPIPYLKSLLQIIIPTASGLTLFAAAAGLLNANSVMLNTMAEKGLFHFSDYLKLKSAVHRPWVTILLMGFVAFVLATAIPSISIIGNLCNTGVFMSFILPFISLIILQQQMGKKAQLPLTIFALIMVVGLMTYGLYNLGDTLTNRVIYSLPFVAYLGIAALMYTGEPETQPAQ